jgi:hypothetical protein
MDPRVFRRKAKSPGQISRKRRNLYRRSSWRIVFPSVPLCEGHARQHKRFEEPLTGGRASPRAEKAFSKPAVYSVLDQGRLWASGTTDREDAIPPSAWPWRLPDPTRPMAFICGFLFDSWPVAPKALRRRIYSREFVVNLTGSLYLYERSSLFTPRYIRISGGFGPTCKDSAC